MASNEEKALHREAGELTAEQEKLRRAALTGAIDEDGDIVWFVSPRSQRPHKPGPHSAGTRQTIAPARDDAGSQIPADTGDQGAGA
jgi:hypothetical protein